MSFYQSQQGGSSSVAMEEPRRLGTNAEIGDLLDKLKHKISALERLQSKVGTHADNAQLQQKINKLRGDSKSLCQKLVQKIKAATHAGKADKRVMKRLSSEFQQSLERFTRVSRALESREARVVRRMSVSHDQADEETGLTAGLMANQAQSQAQEDDIVFLDYDVQEIERRNKEILTIAQDVNEIHDMYQDLQVLVNEQGESLDILEANVTSAKDQTEQGTTELFKAEEYQKKSRQKMCCLFALVMIGVGGVIVAVFASK